ncbi:hypothetical protein AMTRI_Chr09g33340 [Amborella trichopoda]|uniref:Uncharacterized protein n=1 Tax=Amborella trichopoda TaxID=13333 RepID=U5CUT4_AMBTC|nr:hypothetical protein AMTR_s00044p00054130 [Amborella trichopoda]
MASKAQGNHGGAMLPFLCALLVLACMVHSADAMISGGCIPRPRCQVNPTNTCVRQCRLQPAGPDRVACIMDCRSNSCGCGVPP